MAAKLTFGFEQDERILFIGFAAGSELATPEDLDELEGQIASRCEAVRQRVHLFFDLANLVVASGLVEHFGARKRALCDRFALSTWHFGGNLAERVMTRNDLTRRGLRPNLFRTREEALDAFRETGRAIAEPRPQAAR
ncbi:MAG TPA: hypothetical protein DFS52_15650 [Myxococcales bacterium]|jgi:hypothetical protein|nr:hypothetical protein [Myxococcales bacterium]